MHASVTSAHDASGSRLLEASLPPDPYDIEVIVGYGVKAVPPESETQCFEVLRLDGWRETRSLDDSRRATSEPPAEGARCQVRRCARTAIAQVALPDGTASWDQVNDCIRSAAQVATSSLPLLATSPEVVLSAFRRALEGSLAARAPELTGLAFLNLYVRNQFGPWRDFA